MDPKDSKDNTPTSWIDTFPPLTDESIFYKPMSGLSGWIDRNKGIAAIILGLIILAFISLVLLSCWLGYKNYVKLRARKKKEGDFNKLHSDYNKCFMKHVTGLIQESGTTLTDEHRNRMILEISLIIEKTQTRDKLFTHKTELDKHEFGKRLGGLGILEVPTSRDTFSILLKYLAQKNRNQTNVTTTQQGDNQNLLQKLADLPHPALNEIVKDRAKDLLEKINKLKEHQDDQETNVDKAKNKIAEVIEIINKILELQEVGSVVVKDVTISSIDVKSATASVSFRSVTQNETEDITQEVNYENCNETQIFNYYLKAIQKQIRGWVEEVYNCYLENRNFNEVVLQEEEKKKKEINDGYDGKLQKEKGEVVNNQSEIKTIETTSSSNNSTKLRTNNTNNNQIVKESIPVNTLLSPLILTGSSVITNNSSTNNASTSASNTFTTDHQQTAEEASTIRNSKYKITPDELSMTKPTNTRSSNLPGQSPSNNNSSSTEILSSKVKSTTSSNDNGGLDPKEALSTTSTTTEVTLDCEGLTKIGDTMKGFSTILTTNNNQTTTTQSDDQGLTTRYTEILKEANNTDLKNEKVQTEIKKLNKLLKTLFSSQKDERLKKFLEDNKIVPLSAQVVMLNNMFHLNNYFVDNNNLRASLILLTKFLDYKIPLSSAHIEAVATDNKSDDKPSATNTDCSELIKKIQDSLVNIFTTIKVISIETRIREEEDGENKARKITELTTQKDEQIDKVSKALLNILTFLNTEETKKFLKDIEHINYDNIYIGKKPSERDYASYKLEIATNNSQQGSFLNKTNIAKMKNFNTIDGIKQILALLEQLSERITCTMPINVALNRASNMVGKFKSLFKSKESAPQQEEFGNYIEEIYNKYKKNKSVDDQGKYDEQYKEVQDLIADLVPQVPVIQDDATATHGGPSNSPNSIQENDDNKITSFKQLIEWLKELRKTTEDLEQLEKPRSSLFDIATVTNKHVTTAQLPT